MHIFLDNFHQGENYSAQIASQHEELSREESLSISSLKTDYLNLDISSGCGKNSERDNIVHTKCDFCGGANNSAEFFSKISESKSKNLVRLVIRTTDVRNARLTTVLDADLKII